MAKKIDQVVPEIIDSVDGLNAKMNAMREAQKVFSTYRTTTRQSTFTTLIRIPRQLV